MTQANTNTLKLKTRQTKAEFLALPANERRVLLAKDVIASILAKKIIATKGLYLQVIKSTPEENSSDKGPTEVEVCHAIFDSDAHCECCARGALLMARIGYQHPVEEACEEDQLLKGCDDVGSSIATKNGMLYDFTVEQIGVIEAAFERDAEVNFYGHRADREAAAEYGYDLYNADGADNDTVLMALMQNIVDNNGEFIVPVEY